LIVIPSALYIIFLLIGSLTGYFGVDGWTSLIVSVWFLGGLIIFILGIIAIYLSVIFVETKPRPYTIVRQYYTHQHQDHTNPSDLPILAAQELTHHDLD
jgi:putative glycosyltransferase